MNFEDFGPRNYTDDSSDSDYVPDEGMPDLSDSGQLSVPDRSPNDYPGSNEDYTTKDD